MGVGLSHTWISARVPRQTTCNIFLNDAHSRNTHVTIIEKSVSVEVVTCSQ